MARLLASAQENWWDFEGYLVGHGHPLSLGEMPLDRAVAYVYWRMVSNADEQERSKFEARLWMPPPKSEKPIPKESPWSAESEMAAFNALKAETGS